MARIGSVLPANGIIGLLILDRKRYMAVITHRIFSKGCMINNNIVIEGIVVFEPIEGSKDMTSSNKKGSLFEHLWFRLSIFRDKDDHDLIIESEHRSGEHSGQCGNFMWVDTHVSRCRPLLKNWQARPDIDFCPAFGCVRPSNH